MADYRGKVVLLDFWATWCGPCLAELPQLAATYESLHDQGFEILGISLDQDEETLTRFLERRPEIGWRQVLDRDQPQGSIARRYDVSAIPRYFLVGRDGYLVAPDRKLRGPELRRAAAKALAEIHREGDVQKPGNGTFTAVGRIVDAADRPVAGAWVRFHDVHQGVWSPLSLTDATGRFELSSLPEGLFEVAIGAAGFAPRFLGDLSRHERQTTMDLGELSLKPGYAVIGRVLDAAGRPLAGAEVIAYSATVEWWRQRAVRHWPARYVTGNDGGFGIGDLSLGARVSLKVQRRGFATVHTTAFAPSDEPVRVRLKPAVDFTGRVFDDRQEPLSEAHVELLRAQPGDSDGGRAFTGPSGHFRIEDVPAGSYRLLVRGPGLVPFHELVDVAEGSYREIRLTAGAGVVTGRILTADGKALAGAIVNLTDDATHTVADSTKSGADGRYRLEGIDTGVRTLFVQPPAHHPVIREIDVQSGINELDVTLPATAEVSGRVLSAAGVPVAKAIVTLHGGSLAASLSVTSDRDGDFRFAAVARGRYQLWARARSSAGVSGKMLVEVGGEAVSGLIVRLEDGS